MRTFRQLRLATTLITILISLPTFVGAQSTTIPSQELKNTATLSEALGWLTQTIFTYAAISVDDEKTGVAFFKGFQVVQVDGCTFTLKNEGKFTQTQVPYLYEATLPIADLSPSSSKLFQYVTDYPNINKSYGTWNVRFPTKDKKKFVRMYSKNSPVGDFKGHLVTFKFQEEEDAKRFEKGFKQIIKLCGNK